MYRRTQFLLECVAELKLGGVEVRRARAEDLAGAVQADVVTSRAVASLDRLAVLASGLARPGGLVLAIKGANAGREVDRALPVLRKLGVMDAEIVAAGVGLLDRPTTVVRFRTGHTEGGRDRRAGRART
jgi:16S rRNA (guanine527-N7)-methyltransferase